MIGTLQEFMTNTDAPILASSFVVNILIAGILSVVLGYIYVRFGKSLSNRTRFANNFVILSMTTMLIITIVKSSLALSLGLVGALSIVRFRAAIKEPEELTYLFLAIAIGLGLGANQATITLIGFIIVASVICVQHYRGAANSPEHLVLTVSSQNRSGCNMSQIVEILKEHCTGINLRRFDETKSAMEASFTIQAADFDNLMEMKEALNANFEDVQVSFIDNKGLM